MFNPRRNRKGFTIIELIVVIAILAILAAIAIPSFIGITQEAENKVALSNAASIATAINSYNALNPKSYITSLANAQSELTTAGLWPNGLTAADVTAALALITYNATTGVATVTDARDTAPSAAAS